MEESPFATNQFLTYALTMMQQGQASSIERARKDETSTPERGNAAD